MRSGHLTKWQDGRTAFAAQHRCLRRRNTTRNLLEEPMHPLLQALSRGAAVLTLVVSFNAGAQPAITLHGAVQFNDDHAFTKAQVKFEELVKKNYGKPVNFVLHKNSALSLEKYYYTNMNQGISIDN